jgi:hypothetical protein
MLKRNTLSAVLAGSMVLSAQSAMAQGFDSPEQARFSYAVKFVCSKQNEDIDGTGLLRGAYATAINVHNPELKEPVAYFKKFVQGFIDQGQGRPSDFEPGPRVIEPNHAFEVECNEILRSLPDHSPTNPTATGFVVFLTQSELDITAVYTAGPGAHSEVASIEVEPIAPRQLGE